MREKWNEVSGAQAQSESKTRMTEIVGVKRVQPRTHSCMINLRIDDNAEYICVSRPRSV